MSLKSEDWMKILGAAALAFTGAGLAGAGPLAGMLGATGAGTAGAGTAAAATGTGGALSAMTPAMAELSAGTAASQGLFGTASPIVGNMLLGQSAGLGVAGASPKYDITPPGQPGQSQDMDLTQLLAPARQQQPAFPKLQLGLRGR